MTRQAIITIMAMLLSAPVLDAVELPKEFPLWDKAPTDYPNRDNIKEQSRTYDPKAGSPSGSNRVFSSVSSPTYSIHRPARPNGVGLVICPGGGFRDVWLDREGHDLAVLLAKRGVTCLVLKYRTQLAGDTNAANTRANYLEAVQADGRCAIRILRSRASELGLEGDRIGICGFSAGGHLALSCAVKLAPSEDRISSMPDFAGLFYPGVPDDVEALMAVRAAKDGPAICPMFIMNARVDKLTPAEKCVDFYAMLLEAGVNAELHVFGKGSHGFDLGAGAGKSAAMWPESFVAWLKDIDMITD